MFGVTVILSLLAAIATYYRLRLKFKVPWWTTDNPETQPVIENRLIGLTWGLLFASWLTTFADAGFSWVVLLALPGVLSCQLVGAYGVIMLVDCRKDIDDLMKKDESLTFLGALRQYVNI